MRSLTDQMHRTVLVPDLPQRIISLVPSQTELLHDLGLGDRVVGITKFCIHPEAWFRSKARVGGTKQVDIAKVRALMPDLIIGNKEENARADIEALEQEFPVWMSDIDDLGGALDMIRRVGAMTGTGAGAEGIARGIEAAFAGLRAGGHGRRAAYLIWRDPWMVAGPGTFIDDMLGRCGLVNVFRDHADRYPAIDLEELAARGPDLVLLSSEPYPFGDKHLPELRDALPKATALLVDGEPFSWYGSRLLSAPAYFNGLLGGPTV
ncbi:MAG: ABC transporter substrate-binding protein [Flavobacteriales bacterium]|nr:Vitamin B12-binding protein [Flavobacteriales bacterium]MCC6577225.1 ABC transporter substrate-binding protein [Flavobacteriales bacterium]NUQ14777.1 ABC transporter substrate-binding protein [Flavobacteriales bacterium]